MGTVQKRKFGTNPRFAALLERLEARRLLAAQIYVTNVQGNTVGQFDSTGATVNAALVPGGGNTYQGIAVSGSNIFIANYYANTIAEYTTSGATVNASLVTGVGAPGTGPFDVAVSGNQLFVAIGNGGSSTPDGGIAEYTLGATPGTIASSDPSFVSGLEDVGAITVSGSDIYITDYARGVVGEYTTSGTTVNATLVSGLSQPESVAVSGSDLFVSNYGNNAVGEYDATTGATINASLITGVAPLGLAASGSNLFLMNNGTTVGEYTTSGATVNASLITGLTSSLDLAVTGGGSSPSSPPASPPPPGPIFVTNFTTGTIGEYDISGATINASLITGLDGPEDVAVSGSDLFVTNKLSGTVGEYTTSGAVVNASLISGLDNPDAITVSGSDLFVASFDNPGTIGEYTTSGATVNASLVSGLDTPSGMVVSGSDLFVTGYNNSTLGEYATDGTTVNASLVPGLDGPVAIAASGSNLFVVNILNGTVGEYTTAGATVNAALVSGLTHPNGIAVAGSDLFITDSVNDVVGEYATDGSTVNASLVSGLSVPAGLGIGFSQTIEATPQLAFPQPLAGTTAGGLLGPITVDVEDSNGNILSGDNSNVTLALGIGPSGATLGGTTTVAAVNGVATFSDLTLPAAGNYTLVASDGTDSSATSTAFTISSSIPAQTVGGLDTSFGTNGLSSHDVGFTSTEGVVVQSNGQSVILGTTGTGDMQSFGLTRYNADGSLDTSFGSNGVAAVHFAGTDDPAALTLLSDGDLLVAGTVVSSSGGSEFALAEFTSGGALDTSFGGGTGTVLTSFSATAGALSNDTANAVVVAPKTGAIYVGGSSDAGGAGLDFAVAAYTASGSANTAFGTNGTVLLDFSGGDDVIRGLALQTNGDLVAAGSSESSGGVNQVALARFLPTGAIDPHFGSKGKLTTSVRGVDDEAASVAIDSKGRIVVGGVSATGSAADGSLSSDFLLIRYTAAGAVDRTFGGGPIITPFGQPAAVTQIVIQKDGDIVASGKTTPSLTNLDPSDLQVAVARYLTNGQLDTTFDQTGTAVFDLSPVASPLVIHAPNSDADFSSFSVDLPISPADASSDLLQEFTQFEQSAQGVVAVTQGGELLDVGNSGTDTVEAEIVTAGVNLAASIIAKLPPAALEGAKGTLSVKVTETGTEPASGIVTLQLYASPDGQIDNGLAPFVSYLERINVKTNKSQTYNLRYTLPATAGSYFVLADVDTGSLHALDPNSIPAIAPSPVQVAAPFVDLAASGLTDSNTPAAGKTASITFTVADDGNITARAVPVQILFSPDGAVDDGTQIAEPNLALNLPAGVTRKYHLSFKVPKTVAAGSYVVVAVLDPNNSLNDPNLTNNILVGTTTFNIT